MEVVALIIKQRTLKMNSLEIRTYSELILLPSFEERFEYLKIQGCVGEATFGYDRFINQQFYSSPEWRRIRRSIILRDNACDLAIPGRELNRVVIHHMNPISLDDLVDQTDWLLNPEYLICVSHDTHNALHYGSLESLPLPFAERTQNDMCPWKH